MAEELLEFENTVEDEAGQSWVATVMGAEREDGKWIGWVRFDPAGGGESLTSDRETTQPNRADLQYWATGLTYFYLEGALVRARRRSQKAGAARAGSAGRSKASAGAGASAAAAGSAGAARSATAARPAGELPEHGVPRLEVFSLDGGIAEEIMGGREPRPGTSRRVPDAGVVVYEGAEAEREGAVHRFAVQCGTGTAASNMANWLWSRLHRAGGKAEVNGRRPETNAELRAALEARG